MKLQMRLNSPGAADGLLKLVVNGETAIDRTNMLWRTDPNVNIEGVNIASWFGGSSESWGPPTDQQTQFRNFRMYYDGPAEQMARATPIKEGPQTVIEMEIDEAP